MKRIRASKAPYVLLLNNDTEVTENFVEEMLDAIKRHRNAFFLRGENGAVSRQGTDWTTREIITALWDGPSREAGDVISMPLKKKKKFLRPVPARPFTEKRSWTRSGFLMREHFAYLEDVDIGYRARIYGYENWYAPEAVVYHVGSGTSGSRYNQFKTRYSSRNNVYLVYKNMPFLQILLNLPFLAAGFMVKFLFFAVKGMGREYLAGIKNGFSISRRDRKVPFTLKHLKNYCRIQLELWRNILRRFGM